MRRKTSCPGLTAPDTMAAWICERCHIPAVGLLRDRPQEPDDPARDGDRALLCIRQIPRAAASPARAPAEP